MKRPVRRGGRNGHFARVGELDRVADEVEQHQVSGAVPMTLRQARRNVDGEAETLPTPTVRPQ